MELINDQTLPIILAKSFFHKNNPTVSANQENIPWVLIEVEFLSPRSNQSGPLFSELKLVYG